RPPARRGAEGPPSLARPPGYRNRRPGRRGRAPGGAGREEDRVPQALVDHAGAHRPALLHRADAAPRNRRGAERLAVGTQARPGKIRPSPRAHPTEERRMPHKSRLSTFVLDCKVDDLAPHVEFWSKALGKPVASADEDGDGRYAVLETGNDEPILLLQKVGHDSRIHLDIETDDIE